jgi:hypothetical protein
MFAQVRRPVIKASPQLQLSTIVSIDNPTCCRLPGS